jgi:predicted transcriptional regulator YdeE
MEHSIIKLDEIQLMGLKVRTSHEEEQDEYNGKMFPLIKRYFHDKVFDMIPERSKPGVNYCIFTDRESRDKGAFTYFVGEAVSSLDEIPEGLETLTIPAQKYAKITSASGSFPEVRTDTWKAINEMSIDRLGGDRSYHTDFEVYDQRAADHSGKIVMDIFVGIED